MLTSQVAVVGIGRIGLPVVRNLVRAGYRVRAHDVRPETAVPVAAAGATWAGSVAALLDGADVLLSVLPGSPELRALMLGRDGAEDGLLGGLPTGCTWIDLTSASPALGAELAASASARGLDHLDAPLGGGVAAVEAGDLTLYVGGEPAVLERHRALLDVLAGTVHHLGPAGSGYLTKLLVNLLWFGQAVATSEALLLGQSAGLAPERLREVFADSAASSEFIRAYLPALLVGDYLTTFGLDRIVEELDSVVAAADARGVPFELSAAVARTHRQALAALGAVDGELMGVAYLERLAGARLRGGR